MFGITEKRRWKIVKNIIKNNIRRYVYDIRKVVVLIIFAFFCVSELRIAKMSNMSLCEYMLLVMGNHYYVIYFMFMSYIFFSFESIKQETTLLNIRLKKIKWIYLSQLFSVLIQTVIFVMAHVLIAFLIGITKFEFSNQFKSLPIDGYYNDTLQFVFAYGQYMNSPVVACIMTVIFLIVGLTTVSVFVYVIQNIFEKKAAILFVGILILDIMIGFKMGIKGVAEIFFYNNYFIFHHALFQNGYGAVVVNFIIEIVLIVCLYYLTKLKKGNKITHQKGNITYTMNREAYVVSVIFVFLYIVLNVIYMVHLVDKMTGIDILFINLLGYSSKMFDFMEFIRYIIFFIIPVFFVGTIVEKERNLYQGQVAIRYGNKRKWERKLERNINRYILGYMFLFLMLIMVMALTVTGITHGHSEYVSDYIKFTGINKTDLYYVVLLSLSLKLLELFYYKNIFLLWNTIMKNETMAYISTFIGFVVAVILQNEIYVSYGCSSIYNLTENITHHGMTMTIIIPLMLVVKIVVIKGIRFVWRKNK